MDGSNTSILIAGHGDDLEPPARDAAFDVAPAAVAGAVGRIHRLWAGPGPVVGGALGSA